MSETLSIDTAVRLHHDNSPSSLQASEACALFQNENRESNASILGTLSHKGSEKRDLDWLRTELEKLEFPVDVDAQLDAVAQGIAKEQSIIDELTGADDEGNKYPPTIAREIYLSVGSEKVGEFTGITGGFPDTIVLRCDKVHAVVFDLKFGKMAVTPTKDNLQGIAYALGCFEKWPTLETIKVEFFAPFQGWSEKEQEEIYSHTFSRSQVIELELRIRTVVARKNSALEALKKGDWSYATPRHGNCIWCRLKGECRACHALVIKGNAKHDEVEVPEKLRDFRLQTKADFAAAFRFANFASAIAQAIKSRCTQAAIAEDMLPDGFKITERSDREIVSLPAVIEAAKRHGVPKKEIETVLTIPISKVEKLVKDKAPKGMGAAAVRGFAETLEKLGAVRRGEPVRFLQEIKTPADKPKTEGDGSPRPVIDI